MAENKALYRRFIDEVMVGGNLDLLDELMDAKFVEHEELPPGIPDGPDGVRAWIGMMREAFSDVGAEIHDMVEDGDTVWARWRLQGTHTGEFMGIPPTGKSFEITSIDVVRFQEGRAVEHWGVTDTASMLMQLGVMPEPQG